MNQPAAANSKLKNWRPMGMSFLTHFFLVAFLMLLGYFSRSPSQSEEGLIRRVGIVLAVESDDKETEYLDETDLPQESEDAQEVERSDPAASLPPAIAADLEIPDRPDLPGVESIQDMNLDANKMTEVPVANSNSDYELSAEDLKLIQSEQRLLRARAPKGDPTTINAFGSGGMTGRSFVFVIDRSHSMGSQGLGVIDAARTEITAAINQLEPNHTFQIVGYHNKTHSMLRRELLPANAANKKAVPEHIGNMAAFGGTNHENGLIAAIAFKPDVIMLLTDGGSPELNGGDLRKLNRLAPRGCQIHCVQFGIGKLQTTSNFMMKLAEQNDGSYRYIDVMTWKKN